MSNDISHIILEELRAHRKETQDGFSKINGRVRSLEETRAENKGMFRATIGISSVLSGAIAFLSSLFYNH